MHIVSIIINLVVALFLLWLCVYRYMKDQYRIALIFSLVNVMSVIWIVWRLLYLMGVISLTAFGFFAIISDTYSGLLFFLGAYLSFREKAGRPVILGLVVAALLIPFYAFFTMFGNGSDAVKFMPAAIFLGVSEIMLAIMLYLFYDVLDKPLKIKIAVAILGVGLVGLGIMNPLYYVYTDPLGVTIIEYISTVMKALIVSGLFILFF